MITHEEGARLRFLAHAFFCTSCVTLTAPAERRAALAAPAPPVLADLKVGTKVQRCADPPLRHKIGEVEEVEEQCSYGVLVRVRWPGHGHVESHTELCYPSWLRLAGTPPYAPEYGFRCEVGLKLAKEAESTPWLAIEASPVSPIATVLNDLDRTATHSDLTALQTNVTVGVEPDAVQIKALRVVSTEHSGSHGLQVHVQNTDGTWACVFDWPIADPGGVISHFVEASGIRKAERHPDTNHFVERVPNWKRRTAGGSS